MRWLLPFIACVMLIVIGVTPVAHATELPDRVASSELAALHAPGDGDEVPADADRGYPHHHSICHGHDLAAPVKWFGAFAVHGDAQAVRALPIAVLADRALDAPHRPPIA